MTETNASASGLVTNLLNQIEAMLDAGITTNEELAGFLFKKSPQQNPKARLGEWIVYRNRQPAGECALLMHRFCERKIAWMAKPARKPKQDAYRKALKAVKERRKH